MREDVTRAGREYREEARRQFGESVRKSAEASVCLTPGMKIRSRGRGRGLVRGAGRGPIGTPFYNKE